MTEALLIWHWNSYRSHEFASCRTKAPERQTDKSQNWIDLLLRNSTELEASHILQSILQLLNSCNS